MSADRVICLDVVASFVERENFDGVHVVRIPLGDRHQAAAVSTAVDRFRVFHRVLVGQQVADVAPRRVEHADARAVVGDEDVAAQVDRQAARTAKPTATLLPPPTRPDVRQRDYRRRQRSARVRHVTPEQEPTTCKLQPQG